MFLRFIVKLHVSIMRIGCIFCDFTSSWRLFFLTVYFFSTLRSIRYILYTWFRSSQHNMLYVKILHHHGPEMHVEQKLKLLPPIQARSAKKEEHMNRRGRLYDWKNGRHHRSFQVARCDARKSGTKSLIAKIPGGGRPYKISPWYERKG